MRRVLAFVALFSFGLVLLLWLRPTSAPRPEPSTVKAPETQSVQPAGNAGLNVSGLLAWSGFDNQEIDGVRRKRYELLAKDSRDPPGPELELLNLSVKLFSAQDGSLQAQLRAASGMTHIDTGGTELEFKRDPNILLSDVVLTLEKGHPLAPLELRCASILGNIETRIFEAQARARITGASLDLSGERGVFDLATGSVTFASETQGVLRHERGELELSSNGSLSLARKTSSDEIPVELLVLDARDRAHVLLKERLPGIAQWRERFDLRADQIHFEALPQPEDAASRTTPKPAAAMSVPLEVRALSATQDVDLAYAGLHFFGGTASLDFDARGELRHAQLDAEPRVEIPVEALAQGAGSRLPGAQERLPGLSDLAVLRGTGPLELLSSDPAVWVMRGPAWVDWGDTRLECAGDLRIEQNAEDPERLGLVASQNVQLRRGLLRIYTELLRVDLDPLGVLSARAEGASRVEAFDRAGTPFVLRTSELLRYELAGQAWSVPEALGVEVERLGDDPLFAKAERVLNFDPQAMSFRALGAVELQTAFGAGGGDELELRADGSALLSGTPKQPAWFEDPRGRAEAERLERRGDTLVADGSVRANATEGERRLDFVCQHAELTGTEILLENQELLRSFDALVEGGVQGTIHDGQASYTIECARLRSVQHARLSAGDGPALQRDTDLLAEQVSRARLQMNGEDWRLACRELSAHQDLVRLAGEAELSELGGSLMAHGDVHFERRGSEPLDGRGERLILGPGPQGRLEAADDPADRVSANGLLPDGQLRFAIDARTLAFTEDTLDAQWPHIELFLSEPDPKGRLPKELTAWSESLRADKSQVDFLGSVVLAGAAVDGTPFTLRGARVRYSHTELFDSLRLRSGIEVWDGFELEFGPNVFAYGRELTASNDGFEMRLKGEPAGLWLSGLLWRSDSMVFDLRLRAVRSSGFQLSAAARPVAKLGAPGAVDQKP